MSNMDKSRPVVARYIPVHRKLEWLFSIRRGYRENDSCLVEEFSGGLLSLVQPDFNDQKRSCQHVWLL